MKRKIKKRIKVSYTYTEYEGGGKKLEHHQDTKVEEPVIRWLSQDYVTQLFFKT